MPRLVLAALALSLAACQSGDSADTMPEVDAGAIERAVDTTDDMAPAAPAALVNLNTASEDDFKTVPGVGDRMAHEFDEYRPYASVAQFRREIGKYVDDDQVTAYLAHVFVPVDPNESDAGTLGQIPGVTADAAEALIASRPYADDEAFLTAVSEAAGTDAETARAYLGR